ncbi:MAG: acyltransferase [Saprospiraceae bacterium]|nr:acyltransferase [Saprospiraceae bacterium]
MTNKILQLLLFKINNVLNIYRFCYYAILGVKIDKSTSISKGCKFTWPHKVSIGRNCTIEHNVFFKHDGPYSVGKSIVIGNNNFIGNNTEFNIKSLVQIGNNNLIGACTKFVDHDHGFGPGELISKQECPTQPIILGNDIWIGYNVVILKGVTIGNGSVVAAGAVVTKSIPQNEVWGGVPARKIRDR